MRSLLIIVLLFLPVVLVAQFTYQFDQSIPVKNLDGDNLTMPWAGGLNAAQYNTLDLNDDGKDDLVLFDRMANKVLTYLNVDNHYQYAPDYEELFPEGVTNWILLRDYNCDGRKDIFTGDILGMKVYTNKTRPGENLAWDQFFFFTQPGEPKSPVLLTKGFSGKVNLQLQFDDLPNIADVDGDGDLDIMNVRFVGAGTIEYHQNFSMERYGTCDSLEYERQTQQWGGLTECACGVYAYNGATCSSPSGGRIEHAGGKALLTMDVNNDQVLDLLFSEASCAQIHQFINEGTNVNPVFNSTSTFPTTDPANFLIFPTAYYEDVDFDGVPDLLATPNIFNKEYLTSNLSNSNWFYKNTGTLQNPSFSFVKENFLQDQMIDVGDNAVPAFADADGDGDFDMFIGQDFGTGFTTSIHYYKNFGTSELPAFELITTDYLNLSLFNYSNIKPQFADMNGDGKIDLVFTKTRLQNGRNELSYILNTSSSGLNFSDQTITNIPFPFSYQENIHVADVDKDGLPDLLVGRSTGALEYWRNAGPIGSFNYSLEDGTYLNIGPSVLRQYPASFTADLDNDGNMDLLISNQSNLLSIVSNYREAADISEAVSEIVFNPITEKYLEKNLGGRIWPTAVALFSTNKPVLVVGNIMGGLYLLKNENNSPASEKPQVRVYPVPLQKGEKLFVRSDRTGYLQILTILGQETTPFYIIPGNQETSVTLPSLASGVYLVRMIFGNTTVTKRIVISE